MEGGVDLEDPVDWKEPDHKSKWGTEKWVEWQVEKILCF